MRYELVRTQVIPVPLDDAFAFFADARNLELITPPWLHFEILEAPDELSAGARLRYRLRFLRVPVGWTTEISEWVPPRSFVDAQLRGPFTEWIHTHRLTPVDGGTEFRDHVRYRIPGGPLAPLAERLAVRRALDEIFDYRAERVAELLGTR